MGQPLPAKAGWSDAPGSALKVRGDDSPGHLLVAIENRAPLGDRHPDRLKWLAFEVDLARVRRS